MTLVGYGVLVGIPVISTAWVEQLGFSEVEVGRVAGADLGGLSIGSALTALIIGRFDRRHLVLVGAGLTIAANLLCTSYVTYEQALALRILSGIGSGIYTAIAVANLGGTSKPARAYNMMLFAFACSAALELHVLPRLSMNGIYFVFIGAYLFGLLFLRWIPPFAVEKSLDVELDVEEASDAHHIEHRHVPAYFAWLCLAAIVATYVNIGAYWTYIELASLDAGVAEHWIGWILVWAAFCSILGCLFATLVSDRFGLARPLLAALAIEAGIVGMLALGINEVNLLVSVFLFNFLWIFIDVYQMSTVANVDHSGRFAALLPAAQGLGQIIGPNVAGSVLAAGLGYNGVFAMCAAATLAGMTIYGVMYMHLRRKIPTLADAS
jgi:predicted MFS family arabinose efflux permease